MGNPYKEYMEPKNLVVDGKSLLRVAYHGAKDVFKTNGEHIGGVFGFFSIMRKVINLYNVQTITIFWDRDMSGMYRYEIYPKYKSKRKDYANNVSLSEPDHKFIIQMNRVKQYAEEMYIRQYEHDYVEGDDCIGFYINEKQKLGEKCIIMSGDRDLCQLINDDVYLYMIDRAVLVTPTNYRQYFDHHHTNALLVKTIVGDKSDTIDGVGGVGEKTLLKYIPEIKDKTFTNEEILIKIEEIQSNRKTPLKTLQKLYDGLLDGDGGNGICALNKRIMDLKNPLLDKECEGDLLDIIHLPLDPEERSMKNLIKMMVDDEFLELTPGGWDGYIDFLRPFEKVANTEKELYYE